MWAFPKRKFRRVFKLSNLASYTFLLWWQWKSPIWNEKVLNVYLLFHFHFPPRKGWEVFKLYKPYPLLPRESFEAAEAMLEYMARWAHSFVVIKFVIFGRDEAFNFSILVGFKKERKMAWGKYDCVACVFKIRLIYFRQSCTARRTRILVGNKIDLERSRQVSNKGELIVASEENLPSFCQKGKIWRPLSMPSSLRQAQV